MCLTIRKFERASEMFELLTWLLWRISSVVMCFSFCVSIKQHFHYLFCQITLFINLFCLFLNVG